MCIPLDKKRLGAETSSELIPGSVEREKPDSCPVMVTTIFYSAYLLRVLKAKFWQRAAMYIELTFQINSHKAGWPHSLLLPQEVLIGFMNHWRIKMAPYGMFLLPNRRPEPIQLSSTAGGGRVLTHFVGRYLCVSMETIINLPTYPLQTSFCT